MREKEYHPSLVGPLVLITLGILLLLNQMGRLNWDIWWVLARYWPVILILLGIETLVGISRSRLLYLLGLLLAIAVLGGVIGYAILQESGPPAGQPVTGTENVQQSLQDADRGLVTLRLGGGAIHVGALVDSPNLVEGRVEYAERSRQIEQNATVKNGRIEFELRGRQEIPIWRAGAKMDETWRLQFTPRIPLEMHIDVGAGKIQADLGDLRITHVDLNMGAGSIVLNLPEVSGTATAAVKLAVGEITVVIPSGVGVKLRANKLLGSLNLDRAGFTRSGSDWVSANYATSSGKIDLEIDNVIGSINVK